MNQPHKIDELDLTAPYLPVAIYFEEADVVEYLRQSAVCRYERIDSFLTLAYEMFSGELVGFRFKGFRNFYLKNLASRDKVLDVQFISLVSVLEKAVEIVGDSLFSDQPSRQAYVKAFVMAAEDRVELHDFRLAA